MKFLRNLLAGMSRRVLNPKLAFSLMTIVVGTFCLVFIHRTFELSITFRKPQTLKRIADENYQHDKVSLSATTIYSSTIFVITIKDSVKALVEENELDQKQNNDQENLLETNQSSHQNKTKDVLPKKGMLQNNQEPITTKQSTALKKNTTVPFTPFMNKAKQPIKFPLKILIFAYMRSGSSFFGETFNEINGSFYLYEPLKGLSTTKSQLKILNMAFSCNFSQLPLLYEHEFNITHQNDNSTLCQKHNFCFYYKSRALTSLKNKAKENKTTKIDTLQASLKCRSSKVVPVKIITMSRIKTLESLPSNFKIFHLVRDPRAILNSRKNLGMNLKSQVLNLCTKLQANLKLFNLNPNWLKGRSYQIRYEDIAREPEKIIKKVQIELLGLPHETQVYNWIKAHTKSNEGNDFSLNRNVSQVLNKWKSDLSWGEVEFIQNHCQTVLQMLNYTIYKNKKSLEIL